MKNIAIVCGGYSGEYDVSMESAKLVKEHLDAKKYSSYVIVIEREEWFYLSCDGVKISVDKGLFSLNIDGEIIRFDGVFNVIHGTPGEDGKLQSYLEMIGIPYTSCSPDSSALTFNKFYCNAFVKSYGLNLAQSLSFVKGEEIDKKFVIEKLGLPLFVKPVRSGSSVGISKVNKIEDFDEAVNNAFAADSRILIEEFIEGRELACGLVAKGKQLIVFPLTEIISAKEFFDYEAKYTKGLADEICPAENVPEEVEIDIKGLSSFLFREMDCRSFVRFDFILSERGLYFLEVNSIPGISEASILPQMAKEYGYSMKEFFNIVLDNIFD
jgi:D-alanine-D-alanine ligase